MPSKQSLLGIYYEKVINESITLKLSLLLSYAISIKGRNV